MLSVLKSRKTKILIILTIIGIITLIILEYKDKEIPKIPVSGLKTAEEIKINYEANSQADFYTYSKYIYYCTKDGMQILNSKGESIQNDTFTMTSPYMSYDGNIVAISEKLGNSVYVYDEKGKLYSFNTKLPITSISVNSGGFVSVITKDDNVHYIEVYNTSGAKVSTTVIPVEDGIPISSDISDDNRILAISVVDINDIQIQSKIMFYYTYSEQSSAIESNAELFSSFIKENQIVAILKFMNNNNLVAISDMEISFSEVGDSVQNKYSEKGSIKLNNKLDCIDFVENKYVVVAYGDPFINAQSPEEKGMVKWYNLLGSQVNEFKTNKSVTGLYSGYNSTIIGMNRSFKAVNSKGGLIWEYHAIQDVKKILFLNGTDKVLLVTNNEAIIINIKNKIIGEEHIEPSSETSTEVTTTAPTEKSTESQTEVISTVTTEKEIQKSTSKVTNNKETTTKAENKNEEITKKQNSEIKKEEKNTETTTKKVTEKIEETTTEKPTEKVVEQPTEKPTEKIVETTTEKPTEKPQGNNEPQQPPIQEKPTEQNTQAPPPEPDPVMPE